MVRQHDHDVGPQVFQPCDSNSRARQDCAIIQSRDVDLLWTGTEVVRDIDLWRTGMDVGR